MTDIVNRDQWRLAPGTVEALVAGADFGFDPFALLGPHNYKVGAETHLIIRAFLPLTEKAEVHKVGDAKAVYPLEKTHPAGFFESVIPNETASSFGYTIVTTDAAGNRNEFRDPYSFGPQLSDFDLQLISEGNHKKVYDKLGAHPHEVGGVKGTLFAVWSPGARQVSVVGDFNLWDDRSLMMRKHPAQGVWEIFVPGVGPGNIYKYHIKSLVAGYQVEKADPYGFFSEMRPRTASIVVDLDTYQWQDDQWVNEERARKNNIQTAPISIYELHLGSWRRKWGATGHDESYMSYRQMADELVEYIKQLGYTHVELMPVSEHPFDGSWGYQTTGYYAVTSRFGPPEDFMYLVDLCHQNHIGVLVDWVPAHFPKDLYGLGFFDGTHLYEHADPRQGEHLDWGTYIFNFGRNEVRNFLLSNALFWLDKYHIDGLRVDAVASLLYLDYSRPEGAWVPNKYGGRENLEAIDFLKRFNEQVHADFPHTITAAEDSTAWPMVTKPTYMGGLGFDLKWNMGWMHDMLAYMEQEPIYRRYHHNELTFSMIYAFNENFILPISHDEVVHLKHSMLSKMPGDVWQQFANLRVFYSYMYTHPGKKLLFMGSEFGQWEEWNERGALNWDLLANPSHQGMQKLSADLNHLYVNEAALHEVDDSWDGFDWLEVRDNENSVVAFVRRAKDRDDAVIVCCNFTPVPRYNYHIGVPKPGYYPEIFNSDSHDYWGSGVGNMGGVQADENQAWGNQPHSMSLTIPPLGAVILRVPKA